MDLLTLCQLIQKGCYRPQRSWGKVMFLHLSVGHSVHRGVSAIFLIIMKDEGHKVFTVVQTISALDFLKNNTPSASTSEGIIFDKIQGVMF